MKKPIILASAIAAATSANAAVTYVDTTTSNSTIGGAAPVLGVNYTAGRTGGDGLWGQDLGFFTGGIFAAQGESPAVFNTTVTVPSATYTVYAFYAAQTVGPNWDVSTNLVGEAPINVVGAASPAVLASTLDFGGSDPDFTAQSGNLTLYAINVGTVTGTEISVDFNALDGGDRTWIDGIGYEVVPEPSSFALIGLGALGLLVRRRR